MNRLLYRTQKFISNNLKGHLLKVNGRMIKGQQPQMSLLTKRVQYQFCNKNKDDPPEEEIVEERGEEMTMTLKNSKIEREGKEKRKKLNRYLLFTSEQSLLPFNGMECTFKVGRMNKESLKHQVLYNLLESKGNEVHRIGLVLDKQVNKQMNKYLSKQVIPQGDQRVITNWANNTSSVKIQLTTRPKRYRVKIYEIEVSTHGIFAMGVKYDDIPGEEDTQAITNQLEQLLDLLMIIQQKQGFQNRINNFARSIQVGREIENLMKQEEEGESMKDKIDEWMYGVISETGSIELGLAVEETVGWSQEIIRSRNQMDRLGLLGEQLKKIIETIEEVQQLERRTEGVENAQQQAQKGVKYLDTYYQLNQGEGQQTMQEGGGGNPVVEKYLQQLSMLTDQENITRVKREIDRLSQLDKNAAEYQKILVYLDEVFSVPWQSYAAESWDTNYTKGVLDDNIYGLDKVKDRILEMIAVNRLKQEGGEKGGEKGEGKKGKGQVILLYGPPGVGKTSIAKCIGQAMQREVRLISFGGVSDPHFIKGHRRTYVDSQPGVFVKELVKAKQMNCVMILDEIDKVARSGSGVDPYYSLLEILNPEDSANFNDHYLDLKVDFSQVVFILTANSLLDMLEPLKNRLEVIRVPAYIDQEKIQIAQQYLLPRVLDAHGLYNKQLAFHPQALLGIIKGWCYYESGVRQLKRSLEQISRKYVNTIVDALPVQAEKEGEEEKIEREKEEARIVNDYPQLLFQDNHNINQLQDYLGPPQFNVDLEKRANGLMRKGTTNVMTVGNFIGSVLKLECQYDLTSEKEKGVLRSTGNLKTVIKESLEVGRLNCVKYLNEEEKEKLEKKNIHIHLMSGAIPKDGPSAGCAITLALLSLLKQHPLPANMAITGEISLSGNVMKIGGLQEKVIAAKAVGIDIILCPMSNLSEVLEFPPALLEDLHVICVKKFSSIYWMAFQENSLEGEEVRIVTEKGLVEVEDVGEYLTQRVFHSYYTTQQINRQQLAAQLESTHQAQPIASFQ